MSAVTLPCCRLDGGSVIGKTRRQIVSSARRLAPGGGGGPQVGRAGHGTVPLCATGAAAGGRGRRAGGVSPGAFLSCFDLLNLPSCCFKLPHLLLRTSALIGQTRRSDIARSCSCHVSTVLDSWSVNVICMPTHVVSSGTCRCGGGCRRPTAAAMEAAEAASSVPRCAAAARLAARTRMRCPATPQVSFQGSRELQRRAARRRRLWQPARWTALRATRSRGSAAELPHLMHTDSVLCAECSYPCSTPCSPAVLGTAAHEDGCFPNAAHCGYKRGTHTDETACRLTRFDTGSGCIWAFANISWCRSDGNPEQLTCLSSGTLIDLPMPIGSPFDMPCTV